MRLEQLAYLLDLSETKSINLSAERLFISQPAISQAIKGLEDELECPLLIRTKKGVEFTEFGKAVEKCALAVHDTILTMKEDLYTLKALDDDALNGVLKIGTTPFFNSVFMSDVLQSFSKKYPAVSLQSYEIKKSELVDSLENGLIDVFLGAFCAENPDARLEALGTHPDTSDIAETLIFEEPLYVITHKIFPIWKKKVASLQEISRYPLLLFGADLKEDTVIKQYFKAFASCHVVINTNDIALLCQAVVDGKGVGMLTQSVYNKIFRHASKEKMDELKIIRLQEPLVIRYFILLNKAQQQETLLKAFAQHIHYLFQAI